FHIFEIRRRHRHHRRTQPKLFHQQKAGGGPRKTVGHVPGWPSGFRATSSPQRALGRSPGGSSLGPKIVPPRSKVNSPRSAVSPPHWRAATQYLPATVLQSECEARCEGCRAKEQS